MAFVVEDGTGLSNATSFVSVAFADDYFATLGNDDWAALTVDQKQIRLNRGTAATCGYFVFRGQKLTDTQALCFPRKNVTNPSGGVLAGIPFCVLHAVCEFAIRAVTATTLFPDPNFSQNGRAVKRIKQKAGPLEQDIEYAGPGDLVDELRYPAVDAVMCTWLILSQEQNLNGVVIVPAQVNGVSVSNMESVAENSDRYSGPFDENGKDTFASDEYITTRGMQI